MADTQTAGDALRRLASPTAGDALRRLADILDAAAEPIPADVLGRLHIATEYGMERYAQVAWNALASFRSEPGTVTEVGSNGYVQVTAPWMPRVYFEAEYVGRRRTVTREVREYVLDDAAVSA